MGVAASEEVSFAVCPGRHRIFKFISFSNFEGRFGKKRNFFPVTEFTIDLAPSKIVPSFSFAMAMLRSCSVTCGKRGKSDIAGSVGRPRSGAPIMDTLCAARKSATQTREEKIFCCLFFARDKVFLRHKSRNWFSCLSFSFEERKGGNAKSGKRGLLHTKTEHERNESGVGQCQKGKKISTPPDTPSEKRQVFARCCGGRPKRQRKLKGGKVGHARHFVWSLIRSPILRRPRERTLRRTPFFYRGLETPHQLWSDIDTSSTLPGRERPLITQSNYVPLSSSSILIVLLGPAALPSCHQRHPPSHSGGEGHHFDFGAPFPLALRGRFG